MILQSHPYWHVRSIVEKNPQITALWMSYYTYRPQTVTDTRVAWKISAEDFLDSDQINAIISDTPPEQELALHSNVEFGSEEQRHIVMVDMATSSKAHLEKLRVYLGDHFFQQIAWFSSGRSFHGYGEDLLQEPDWVKFMGLLLLANKPRMEATVDPRWIGHRLLAGYAALRWTKNTSYYLVQPSRIDQNVSKGPLSEVGALGKSFRR
jgi:hypothetical protein